MERKTNRAMMKSFLSINKASAPPQEFSLLLVQLFSLGNPYFGSELSLSKYLP